MSANLHINRTTSIGKRAFDLVLATIGLVLCAPLVPMIVLAIKLESRGPVLIRQLRVGRAHPDRTELFQMLKFRSMVVDAESISGAVWATKHDPRITKVGFFLRKTRLDELPQLINVLLGDMSMIGPRPERPCFYSKLEAAIPYFIERTYGVTPGITGLAQVNQGYDTCLDDVRSKLGYDLSYVLALANVRSWVLMDLNILVRTIATMVMGRGQ